jgi:hypothetical protein
VALKYDMIALGILGRCSDEVGSLLRLSHGLFGTVARQRQVSDEGFVRCLLALKSLFTGELVESHGARMLNHHAHLDSLGVRRRLRRLQLLPRLWAALALESDGGYADALVALLTDPTFRQSKAKSALASEMYMDLTEAIDAVSRCNSTKTSIKRRYLERLAAAVLTLPEQEAVSGDVFSFDDLDEPLDSVAVGNRLREWEFAR